MAEFKVSKDELKNKAGAAADMLKQEVSDDEVNANLNKLPIKNEYVRKYFVAIPAALSLIALFLPFIKFRSESSKVDTAVTYNGFNSLMGECFAITGWFVFLLPAVVIASMFVQQLKPFRKAISVLAPALSLIFEIVTYFLMKSTYLSTGASAAGAVKSLGVSVEFSCSPQIGFFILLISYVLTAGAGLIVYFGWFPKKE